MRKLKKLAPTSNLRLLSFRGTLQRLSVALLTLVMTLTAQTAWADTVDETEVSNWAELKSVSTVNGSTVTLTQCIKTTAELTISETVTLDLNGYGIRSKASSGGVIIIGNGGNLTLKDDAAVKPTRYIPLSGGYGSAVSTSAPGGSYITVSGGYITGSHDSHGVYNSDGTFTMVGGTICGNYKSGIFAQGEKTTTLAGGTITGNHEHGVYIYGANAVLKMTGGTITGNNVDRDGAGVYVGSSGKFIMAGGSITGNTASGSGHHGGGMYVVSGTCIILGGTVSGNSAGSGQGNNVYSYNSTDVYILSGCVDGGIVGETTNSAPKQFSFGTGTDGSDAKPFVISDAAGWNAFCTLINNDIYRDKHFELGDDISVTQMAGSTTSNCFTGIFDGKNHTLDFTVTASEKYIAPFSYVAGATIRNLRVTGTITTSNMYAAGIVARDFYPGLTIVNCRSSVTINSTKKGAGYHSGILSGVYTLSDVPTVNITGCVFDGKIITGSTDATKTTKCSGFVGSNQGTVSITDCLYAPAALADGEHAASNDSYTFVYNSIGSSTITRCYRTRLFGTAQGTIPRSVTAGDDVTVSNIALTGNVTSYTTSGITAYSGGGITYDGNLYYGDGDDVSLTLSHTGRTGYFFTGYSASAGALSGTTLTMPNADVTISANWADPNDFSVNAAGDEYTIKTAKGWDAFCYLLDDNTKGFFDNKTVKLSTDIGTADDPITRMAGASHHDFTGTFDGDGHTLYVNFDSDDITDGSTQYVAPFRYVSNVNSVAAAIRNLHVTGNIDTDMQFTGGLIGGCWGAVSIENCTVSTAINSTISGAGGHGGIVGIHSNGTLTITGCVFDGSLLGTTTHSVGGFIGWRNSSARIYNSLFAPAAVSVLNTSGATFARNTVDTYNCYYTTLLCDGTNYVPSLEDATVSPNKWHNGKQAYEVSAAPERLCNGTGEGIVKTYSNNGLNYGLGFDNKYYLGIIPLSDSETEGVSYLTTNLQGKEVTVEFKRSFTAGKASTICLPFAMNTISGGKVYRFAGITHDSTDGWVATMSDATPDGNNVTATEANKPYVFMPDATGEVTFSGTTDEIPASLTASSTASGDWTFKGTYTKLIYGTAPFDGYVYGFASTTKDVSGEGHIEAGQFVHAKDGASVPPMRCYLTYKNGSQFAGTRGMTRADDDDMPQTITVRFVDTRGEVTAIGTLNTQTGEITTDGWYTLNGTRLNGKPSKRGIYINNGRKIVIK